MLRVDFTALDEDRPDCNLRTEAGLAWPEVEVRFWDAGGQMAAGRQWRGTGLHSARTEVEARLKACRAPNGQRRGRMAPAHLEIGRPVRKFRMSRTCNARS